MASLRPPPPPSSSGSPSSFFSPPPLTRLPSESMRKTVRKAETPESRMVSPVESSRMEKGARGRSRRRARWTVSRVRCARRPGERVQVHRAVLQPGAPAPGPGVCHPRRVRSHTPRRTGRLTYSLGVRRMGHLSLHHSSFTQGTSMLSALEPGRSRPSSNGLPAPMLCSITSTTRGSQMLSPSGSTGLRSHSALPSLISTRWPRWP
jgi:hypothetical protein